MVQIRLTTCVLVCVGLLSACSGDEREADGPSTTQASSTAPESAPVEPCDRVEASPLRPELEEVVNVFVFCGDGVAPVTLETVERVVPADDTPLRSAVVIQHRLGHADPAMSLGVYGHVPDDLDQAAAIRLDDLFRRTPTNEGSG